MASNWPAGRWSPPQQTASGPRARGVRTSPQRRFSGGVPRLSTVASQVEELQENADAQLDAERAAAETFQSLIGQVAELRSAVLSVHASPPQQVQQQMAQQQIQQQQPQPPVMPPAQGAQPPPQMQWVGGTPYAPLPATWAPQPQPFAWMTANQAPPQTAGPPPPQYAAPPPPPAESTTGLEARLAALEARDANRDALLAELQAQCGQLASTCTGVTHQNEALLRELSEATGRFESLRSQVPTPVNKHVINSTNLPLFFGPIYDDLMTCVYIVRSR